MSMSTLLPTLTSTTSAYACIVFALLLWVLISIGYWAWKLAKGSGRECREAVDRRGHSRLVIVSTKRGSRLWYFRLRQRGAVAWCGLAWLESSVLIRLTRGIALMRTSRHSQCTITDNPIPLATLARTLALYLSFSLWSDTWHSMLTSLHCFALD